MNKSIGAVLFIAGIFLGMAGFQASQSLSSDVSKFFTGAITDKAMWMLFGGIAAAVFGATLMSRRNP